MEQGKRALWTIANGVMLLMFAFSIVVQFNDPDPLLWVAIYGAAAALCALEMRRRTPLVAAVTVALAAIGWSASLALRAYDVPVGALFAEWEMRNVRIEEAREMYGLAIVAVWSLAISVAAWRRRRRGAAA